MKNPLLACHFVTEENKATLLLMYKPLLPTQPCNTTVPEVGDVIVLRRTIVFDLFDENVQHWHEHYWLATREEFDQKFYIVEQTANPSFALIALKE